MNKGGSHTELGRPIQGEAAPPNRTPTPPQPRPVRLRLSDLRHPLTSIYNSQPPSQIFNLQTSLHHNKPHNSSNHKMSRLLRQMRLRAPSTIRLSSTFQARPAPPKLPAEQQAEFERLQRAAAVSQAFQPDETPSIPVTTAATSQPRHTTTPSSDESVNQGMFRGAPPEFEGEVNPKTGEVGGPKNEPLRWGGKGDWSYNGRVTDF